MTKEIAEFIEKDAMPLNTGTMTGFTALVKTCQSAQVLVRLPYQGYSKHAVREFFATTADMWSSLKFYMFTY